MIVEFDWMLNCWWWLLNLTYIHSLCARCWWDWMLILCAGDVGEVDCMLILCVGDVGEVDWMLILCAGAESRGRDLPAGLSGVPCPYPQDQKVVSPIFHCIHRWRGWIENADLLTAFWWGKANLELVQVPLFAAILARKRFSWNSPMMHSGKEKVQLKQSHDAFWQGKGSTETVPWCILARKRFNWNSPMLYITKELNWQGQDEAQFIGRVSTRKLGTILMQVQFYGAAKDFSPRINTSADCRTVFAQPFVQYLCPC